MIIVKAQFNDRKGYIVERIINDNDCTSTKPTIYQIEYTS